MLHGHVLHVGKSLQDVSRQDAGMRLHTFQLCARREQKRPSLSAIGEQQKRSESYGPREDDLGREPWALELVWNRMSDNPHQPKE